MGEISMTSLETKHTNKSKTKTTQNFTNHTIGMAQSGIQNQQYGVPALASALPLTCRILPIYLHTIRLNWCVDIFEAQWF